jgi:predicted transcriptional regulator
MATLKMYSDGFDGFEARVMAHARALDRGSDLLDENSITFNSAEEMFAAITPKRIALLRVLASDGPKSVTMLSKKLNRTKDAVMRDLRELRKIKAIKTVSIRTENGSRVLIAKPLATRYEFASSIDIHHTAA